MRRELPPTVGVTIAQLSLGASKGCGTLPFFGLLMFSTNECDRLAWLLLASTYSHSLVYILNIYTRLIVSRSGLHLVGL